MSSSCKICVLPRSPETVVHRWFNMDQADRAGIAMGAPRSAWGVLRGLRGRHGYIDMTACPTTGQHVAMLEVAVVFLDAPRYLDSLPHKALRP